MKAEQGFILAACIWMVAILSLLGALFHGYAETQVNRALAVKQRSAADRDIYSTSQTLIYLLGTRRVTLGGLTVLTTDQQPPRNSAGLPDNTPTWRELRLDRTSYEGFGASKFSLQDQAGLIGLNSPSNSDWLKQLIRRESGAEDASVLTATLADYIDLDDRRRIGGAESDDYLRRGMPAPVNDYLRTNAELRNVYRWGDWLSLPKFAHWHSWFGTNHANIINVNTAPIGLLQLILGITPEESAELEQARKRMPFRSLDAVAKQINRLNRWPENRFRFMPGNRISLELWCLSCNYSIVQTITLTPRGLLGPFHTDYRYRKTLKQTDGIDRQIDPNPSPLFEDALLVVE